LKLRSHITSIALIAVLLVCAASVAPNAKADMPSHLQPAASSDIGFDYSTQGSLFNSLGALSQAVMVNVSQSQWNNATANAANYTKVANYFSTLGITRENDVLIVEAIQSSKDDLTLLVATAQHYDELSAREGTLISSDPKGNESQNNALEMRALAADMKGLSDDLNNQYAKIIIVTEQNGLDTSRYTNTAKDAKTYAAQMESGSNNVTNGVFQDTNTTLDISPTQINYGEALHFSGAVQANQAAVSNATVDITIDGATVASAVTNTSGQYKGVCTVQPQAPTVHTVVAHFDPASVPLNPSNSSSKTVTVGTSGAKNELNSTGSLLQDNLNFAGTIVTDSGSPVKFAGVTLYVNNNPYATLYTDENGSYSTQFHQSFLEHFAAFVLPQRYQVYTRFDGVPSVNGAQSDVLVPASGGIGLYAIVALLVGGILTTLFLYNRLVHRRPPSLEAPVREVEPPLKEETSSAREESDESRAELAEELITVEEISASIERAEALSADGQGELAIREVYGALVRALSSAQHVGIEYSMTAREIYFRIVDSAPELRAPLGVITSLYEMASYTDRPILAKHVSQTLEAAVSISEMIAAGGDID